MAPPRPKVSLKGNSTPEWAKEYLPTVAGTSLSLDLKRHFRWSVRYESKPEAPKGTSRAFGAHEQNCSKAESLKFCLQWVCKVHTDLTGEACPHDFEAMGPDA